MKTDRLASLVAAVAILGTVSGAYAAPLGTGFTYQGQLKKAGVPLNGTADLQFTLWDAAGSGSPPTGGAQIGNMHAVNAQPVTDGLFTVALNPTGQFGANAFNGEARWVQVAVRSPAGVGVFTTLSPRQPLTAAPHALFALNAATATNATQLNGQSASFYQNAANLIAGTLNAARLPNPLTLTGNNVSHIVKGENTSTDDGSSGVYGVSSGAGLGGTGVSGRSDRTFGTGVFGLASNDSGINFGGYFTSDSTSGRGVYGIVQGAPAVSGGPGAAQDAFGVYGEANFNSGPAYGVYGESRSISGYGVYGKASASFGETCGGYFWSTSPSEGIGVVGLASAGDDLDLANEGKAAALGGGTTYGGLFQSYGVSGTGVYGYASNIGTTYGVRGRVNSPEGYAGYFEGRGYFEGDVGIGTTTPDRPLEIENSQAVVRLTTVNNDNGSVLELQNANPGAILGSINFIRPSATPGQIAYLGNVDTMTFTTNGAEKMRIDSLGRVGIGTTTPDTALDVNGNISVTASPGNEMVIKNRDVWTHSLGAQTFGDGAGAHFIVASKEGVSESAGVFGDGDALTLWSAGDSISGQPPALIYVLDEDDFGDADGNPYNNGALKAYLSITGLWVQSDMRRKQDFAPINQACEKIGRISAYTFEYIPSPEDVAKGDVPKRVPGLIAQEVEKVLPEAVAINADGEYFMNYSLLVPLLVQSVKELNERLAATQAHTEPSVVPLLVESVRDLNEALAAKQAHIEALEVRLAALEGRLSVLNPPQRSSGE